MSDPYKQLQAAVRYHLDYYREAGEYVSKRHVLTDLRKDVIYPELLDELGIVAEHPRASATFAATVWPIAKKEMTAHTGWHAFSRGRGARYFHESWEDHPELSAYVELPLLWRDVVNERVVERERDAAMLESVLEKTEASCLRHGWTFDPQFDEMGELIRVEVWAA